MSGLRWFWNRDQTCADGSTYRYKLRETEPLRRVSLAWWILRVRRWHPQQKRLARLRALYWTLLRFYETEICDRCGGPVGLVFHVPDELWAEYSGYGEIAKRSPSGESGAGCLCVKCFDDLYEIHGGPSFPLWTCRPYDEWVEEVWAS